MKLRQRRQRRRRRREELQEEERRRQRVRFSAATLSQARLVPPPAGASALAPRLPRSRPLPGSGPARRWSHSRRGCQAWGERGAAVFPRHPPLDAPQPVPGSAGLLSGRTRSLCGHLRLPASLSPRLPPLGLSLGPVLLPPSQPGFPGLGKAMLLALRLSGGFILGTLIPEPPASAYYCGWAPRPLLVAS